MKKHLAILALLALVACGGRQPVTPQAPTSPTPHGDGKRFAQGPLTPPGGTITSVLPTSGGGLAGGGIAGSVTIGLLRSCSSNQVLVWNGTSWVCGTAGVGGTLTAGIIPVATGSTTLGNSDIADNTSTHILLFGNGTTAFSASTLDTVGGATTTTTTLLALVENDTGHVGFGGNNESIPLVIRNTTGFAMGTGGTATAEAIDAITTCTKTSGTGTLTCQNILSNASGGDNNYDYVSTSGTMSHSGPASFGNVNTANLISGGSLADLSGSTQIYLNSNIFGTAGSTAIEMPGTSSSQPFFGFGTTNPNNGVSIAIKNTNAAQTVTGAEVQLDTTVQSLERGGFLVLQGPGGTGTAELGMWIGTGPVIGAGASDSNLFAEGGPLNFAASSTFNLDMQITTGGKIRLNPNGVSTIGAGKLERTFDNTGGGWELWSTVDPTDVGTGAHYAEVFSTAFNTPLGSTYDHTHAICWNQGRADSSQPQVCRGDVESHWGVNVEQYDDLITTDGVEHRWFGSTDAWNGTTGLTFLDGTQIQFGDWTSNAVAQMTMSSTPTSTPSALVLGGETVGYVGMSLAIEDNDTSGTIFQIGTTSNPTEYFDMTSSGVILGAATNGGSTFETIMHASGQDANNIFANALGHYVYVTQRAGGGSGDVGTDAGDLRLWPGGTGRIDFVSNTLGYYAFEMEASGSLEMAGGQVFKLSSSGDARSGADVGFSRNTAGVLEIDSGTAGTLRDLTARNILLGSAGGYLQLVQQSGTATAPKEYAYAGNPNGVISCTKGDISVDTSTGSTGAVWQCSSGTTWTKIAPGSGVTGGPYGNGGDGALTFDGTTTVVVNGTSIVPSSNVYTLPIDISPSTMTVNSGVTVAENNHLIQVQGTLTNNGTLSNDGAAGALNTAGPVTNAARYGATQVGGSAGVGGANSGAAPRGWYVAASGASGGGTNTNGSSGGAGTGVGGGGGGGNLGAGAAGGSTSYETTLNVVGDWNGMILDGSGYAANGGSRVTWTFGAGGGSGGSCSAQRGGGGAGGGMFYLAAATITGTGSIHARGGAGGPGTATNGCAGGGGGGGGLVLVEFNTISGQTCDANGGSGGSGTGTGGNGGAGGSGKVQVFNHSGDGTSC